MGLDNIPREYPCKEQGIATLDETGRIDCDLTQSAGNCPWKNEFEKSVLLKEARPTYGMLGTNCWYRGKYGNFLLRLLEDVPEDSLYDDTEYSFYGNGIDDESEGMSVDYCWDMFSYMERNTELFAHKAKEYVKNQKEESSRNFYSDEKELINDWIYATWWVKFAAKYCNGSTIWY
jgi:hypothetical protein